MRGVRLVKHYAIVDKFSIQFVLAVMAWTRVCEWPLLLMVWEMRHGAEWIFSDMISVHEFVPFLRSFHLI